MYPTEMALDYERIVQNFESDILAAGQAYVTDHSNDDMSDTEAMTRYQESARRAFRAYRDATLVAQAQRKDGKD